MGNAEYMGLVLPGTLLNKDIPIYSLSRGTKMLWALPILLASLSLCQGMSLVQEERLAFMLCESDGEDGLTWPEVKDCEERFAYLLKEMGQDVPNEEDFSSVDLNSDGILKFEEWSASTLRT